MKELQIGYSCVDAFVLLQGYSCLQFVRLEGLGGKTLIELFLASIVIFGTLN